MLRRLFNAVLDVIDAILSEPLDEPRPCTYRRPARITYYRHGQRRRAAHR